MSDEDIIDDDELILDASLDLDQALAQLPPPPPSSEEETGGVEPEVCMVVEKMPEMVGGLAKLNADLEYPMAARKAGLAGKVVVRVLVLEGGTPSNPEVLRSAGTVLDQVDAVMRQAFVPGEQRSRPVRVMVSVPVRFALT